MYNDIASNNNLLQVLHGSLLVQTFAKYGYKVLTHKNDYNRFLFPAVPPVQFAQILKQFKCERDALNKRIITAYLDHLSENALYNSDGNNSSTSRGLSFSDLI